MIYTSYFAKIRDVPKNSICIAICAIVPSWWKGLTYDKVAPPLKLLQAYKSNHDTDSYTQAYTSQVLDKTSPKRVLREIFRLLPPGVQQNLKHETGGWWENPDYHVILLCYEKSSDFCHRHLLAEWLTENGIEVKEWDNESVETK